LRFSHLQARWDIRRDAAPLSRTACVLQVRATPKAQVQVVRRAASQRNTKPLSAP
jgi:hypothetical protein